jgi:hypothetical protein
LAGRRSTGVAGRRSTGVGGGRASIEAERSGVYDASPDELAAIDRGLEDIRQDRFASDEAVSAIRAKIRSE